MIKQIIRSEEELKKLIIDELEESSSNKHKNNSKEEIDYAINSIINETPKNYPFFLFADFYYIYSNFDISLYSSVFYLTKEEISKISTEL